MMPDGINVAIAVVENFVFAQVLDMPNHLRCACGVISQINGFNIRSNNCPELGANTLYLWGDKLSEDNRVCIRQFYTNAEAMEYANKLCAVIDKYNHINNYNKKTKIETELFSNNTPTNQKLSFEVILWNTLLIMKNTDIKTADRGVKQIDVGNYTLCSSNHPQLGSSCRLYVRGINRMKDDTIMVHRFDSLERAKQYIERLRKATKIWNDNTDDGVKVFTYIPIA